MIRLLAAAAFVYACSGLLAYALARAAARADMAAPMPSSHDAGDCDACAWADVVALTGTSDWASWETEPTREPTS